MMVEQEFHKQLQSKTKIDPMLSAAESGTHSIKMGLSALQDLLAAFEVGMKEKFASCVLAILETRGRVIVSGVGKSGHIGRKIAATLASTGTAAFFVHPTEASHGDLGMITAEDTIIALSWSGETAELGNLIKYSRRFEIKLIAITSDACSSLGRSADFVLELPKVRESCPYDLAPTSSTLIQLACGDALAVALLEQRGFTSSSFRDFHPGGTLAARLKTVAQLMHVADELPLAEVGTPMSEVLVRIAGRRFGCVGVIDLDGILIGLVTDGDLRRHMSPDLLSASVEAVMTPDPIVVEPTILAGTVLSMMNNRRVTSMFVVECGKPVGIIHIHDLLRVGLT